MNKKNYLKRIWTGVKLGWNTPSLPENVINLQKNPLIRILRVLGGISSILILTKKSLLFPTFCIYIFLFLTFIFFIYHIYISYKRIIHIYKTIKSGKLDVKNSPIDKIASLAGKFILCIKGSCENLPHLGIGLGIGAGLDQILENSGREPVFMPFLGDMLNKVIGNETVESGYKRRREIYKELLKLDNSEKLLLEDRKSLDDLIKSEYLSEEDKKFLVKDFWNSKQEIENKRTQILSIISKEIETKDPFGTRKK